MIGVGTTAGGFIPEPERKPGDTSFKEPAIRATLDRGPCRGSRTPAAASTSRSTAKATARSRTRSSTRRGRRAGSRGIEVATEELDWRFLLAAAALMSVGLLFLQESIELWLQAAGRGASRSRSSGR